MSLSQPGIFNALDFGLKAGPTVNPADNQRFLQDAVYAAQAANGGTILIPSEDLDSNSVYYIDGPIYVGSDTSQSPVAIIFAGTGQGTESAATLFVQNESDLFLVDTGGFGDEHVGGITFQDLSIRYTDDSTAGTAVHVTNGENVRVLRVVFTNCPQAVWFEDTLQCSIFESTAVYSHVVPSPACVTLGNDVMGVAAKEVFISACTFLGMAGTGLIIQGAEHVRVSHLRLEGFYEGIKIIPGAEISGGHNTLRHSFEDVTVYTFTIDGNPGLAGTALTIEPQGPQKVSQLVFSHCLFEPSAGSDGSVGPGIYIDEGLDGSIIDNVRFVSCHSTRWSGPGMEIVKASNVEVNGGFYAGNASGASPSGGSGGISIGAASAVRIIGASCIGSYPYIEIDKDTTSPVQDVGIYIAGGGANNIVIDHCDLRGNSQYAVSLSGAAVLTSQVFIRNCNMENYTGNPIHFGAAISIIEVSNCSGYNDQATAVTTTAPAPGSSFSGTTYGYYGTVMFSVAGPGVTQIAIDGHNTNRTSGTFMLGPRDTAVLTYSGGAVVFVMIGQ